MDSKSRKMEIYKDIASSQIPRALGLGDRNPKSKTYGCFDRNFWHYKSIDFPNARFQEVSLLLAILYKNNFPGNRYYKKAKVLEWCKAAIKFWSNIQNRDGSFNEYYPFEHSFVATALTTCAVTEAILNLKIRIEVIGEIEKAGRWLSKENNLDVSNQMAGAAVALHNIYLLTGDSKFKNASREKIKILLRLQSKDGFFPEYGGWDIGYLTISTSFLMRYIAKQHDDELLEAVKKALKFLESKIRGNGSYDNAQSSRKTQYIYPYGLRAANSSAIFKHIKGLEKNEIINPSWMDDRFFIPLTIDYLQNFLNI